MAAAETPDARPVLEEVIVTAEKRSENIQDVPASAPSSVTTSDECKAAAASGDRNYRTPTGSFASKTECTRLPFTMTRPLTPGWKISYSPQPVTTAVGATSASR